MTSQYKIFTTATAVSILILGLSAFKAEAGPLENVGQKIEELAEKAGKGIRKGAQHAGNGIRKGAEHADKGIRKGIEHTGKGIGKAGEKIQGVANGGQKGEE